MSYAYDSVGNLSGYLYPNGVQTNYTFNSLNRLTSLSVSKATTTLASYSYTLAAAGNRLSVTEQSGRRVNYSYDDLYRLTNETITADPVTSNNGSISYSYDAVGNRLSRSSSIAAVPSSTHAFDANDRLTTDSYDSNGNTVASAGNSYSFDFENRLTSLNNGQVSIVYDGDGNRVSKTVGGVTTRYLVDDLNHTGYSQVVEEQAVVGGQSSVARAYTYGNDLISQQQNISSNWSVSFYGYDGHGSVRLLTDASGAVTDTYTYDAFGMLIHQTGSTANDYLYAGEQRDAHLGLDYLRARYMNPATGRFWSMDEFEGFASDPLSLHKYLYVHANPTNSIDPTGNQQLVQFSAAETGFQTIRSAPTPVWLKALAAVFVGFISAGTILTPFMALEEARIRLEQENAALRAKYQQDYDQAKKDNPRGRILFHYTDLESKAVSITITGIIRKGDYVGTHGQGAYATDIEPWQTHTPRAQFARMLFGNSPDALERTSFFVVFIEKEGFEFEKKPRRTYFYPGEAEIIPVFYGRNPMRF